jgi:hypothetical protein
VPDVGDAAEEDEQEVSTAALLIAGIEAKGLSPG